jgi:hypothetical protein
MAEPCTEPVQRLGCLVERPGTVGIGLQPRAAHLNADEGH